MLILSKYTLFVKEYKGKKFFHHRSGWPSQLTFARLFMNINLKNCTFLSVIKKLFLSHNCLSCGNVMNLDQKRLCSVCLDDFLPTRMGNWVSKLTVSRSIDEIYSAWYFTGVVQDLIHGLKYNGAAKTGKLLGFMAGSVLESQCSNIDLLIPVPLFHVRKRERGYNQAEWIARGLSECWHIKVDSRALKRIRNTVSQTSLTQVERSENMKGAFKIRGRSIHGIVGLIDDVATTGSTVSSCAEILKENGAKSVTVITVATPKLTP